MSKKARRIWFVVGLVIVILLIINHFTSNPYEKYRANIKLETYLDKKYPILSFDIANGKYDRQKNVYKFDVTNKNNADEVYQFEVENGDGYKILHDTVMENEVDETASSRLSLEASNNIKEMLVTEVPNVKNVTADVEVLKQEDRYPLWTPTFDNGKKQSAARILIDLDVSGMSKKDMYELSDKVYNILTKEDVNFSSATLTGYKTEGNTGEKKWRYQYKLAFTKEEKPDKTKIVVIS